MSLQKDLKEIEALKNIFEKLRKEPTDNSSSREAIVSVGELFIQTQMESVGKRISRHKREGRGECKPH